MVPSINKTADLVQEIAAASSEQATGVHQINEAISQVNQTMQHNAAASEQLSATSEEMNIQAVTLQESVNYFTLDEFLTPKQRQNKSNKVNKSNNDSKNMAGMNVKSTTGNSANKLGKSRTESDSDDEKFVDYDK